MQASTRGSSSRRAIGPLAAAGACLVLLAGFAALSRGAARTKSPTFDEPLNTVGAWMILHEGDWRVHPDHPALWQYWAALPNGPRDLRPDRSPPVWDDMIHHFWPRYLWAADMLFKQPGVDAERVVARSRDMMLLIALALGGLIALWAWQLAGSTAAMIAVALFALDPNFLGHASLVKNDVALTFSALLLAHSIWRLGQKVTPFRAAVAALAFAAGFGVKFSALLFLPLAALILAVRSLLPTPWPFFGRPLAGRGSRLLAGVFLLAIFSGAAWGVIWASYRFRFAPTENPEDRLDTGVLLERMRKDHLEIAAIPRTAGGNAGMADNPIWTPGFSLRAILWAERHRVLPQAWLYGVVYSSGGLVRREGYLLGERKLTGWWYYLPLAALFKTPLATLAAGVVAAVIGLVALRRSRRSWRGAEACWSAACVTLPGVVFGVSLMASHVSVGLRHALTIYPYVFLGVGVVAAQAFPLWPTACRFVSALLLSGLLVETLTAYPDYVAFFNVWFRPGRLALLGDSNLDWGQDLKHLAAWQRGHPDANLYLAYFGQADPHYYGITYKKLPTDRPGEPGAQMPGPDETAVLAVSATHLQQIYIRNQYLAAFYAELRRRRPLTVLGETIYLYSLTPVPRAF